MDKKLQANRKSATGYPKIKNINKLALNSFSVSYIGGFDSLGPTYAVWYALADAELTEIPRFEDMDMQRITLTELNNIIGEQAITHMCLEGEVPDSLALLAPKVVELRLENVNNIPQSLGSIKSLHKLHINNSKFADGLPKHISELTGLKELKITRCNLCTLPTSLKELKELEKLDVSNNMFGQRFPENVAEVTSISELNMSNCHLTSIPTSLKTLTNLKKLDISYNPFTDAQPPTSITELSGLEDLNLAGCNFSTLTNSLKLFTKLTSLDLSENDFSHGLPLCVTELPSLKTLHLASCQLVDLDESLTNLKMIDTLNISLNKFETLPPVICKLSELRVLILGSMHANETLKNLDENLGDLENLSSIDCRRCEALNYPPYGVCEQGKDAIVKYFNDLKDGISKRAIGSTAAVIGELMSGKTSLIRSLQEGERTFTTRCVTSEVDATTRVFQVEELELEDCCIRLVDFGGHQVYHMAYQMALKDHCIPLIVVNMKQYVEIREDLTKEQATRKVCFDWMSHLYLSCPRLKRPFLILTNEDHFVNDFEIWKKELLETVEALRTDFLREQAVLDLPENFDKILHFEDTSKQVFAVEDVFVFGKEEGGVDNLNLDRLKQSLKLYSNEFKVAIPQSWKEVEDDIASYTEEPYITLEKLKEKYRSMDQLDVIIRYLRSIGKILWYEYQESLQPYIFHQIKAVTEMINLLFHHKGYNDWYKRMERFTPSRYRNRVIDQDCYKGLVEKFIDKGIMDDAVLDHLFREETDFEYTIAMEILQSFYLVHGPIIDQPRNSFILPYFSQRKKVCDIQCDENRLHLTVGITFQGLALPKYVHQLLTVVVLNMYADPDETYYKYAYKNGATVEHGPVTLHLLHDFDKHSVAIHVTTMISNISAAWRGLFIACKKLILCARACGKATRPVVRLACGHCLNVGDPSPHLKRMNEWEYPDPDEKSDQIGAKSYSLGKCFKHEKGEGNMVVPSPLLHPCKKLSTENERDFQHYLRINRESAPHKEPADPAQCSYITVQQPANNDDEEGRESDLSDDDTYMDESRADQNIITAGVKPCTRPSVRELFNQVDEVYWMSQPTRGRCLIINNYHFDVPSLETREGSDVDMLNIENVFSALSFKCVKKHSRSRQEMINDIVEETGHGDHQRYGMFVLVIMTHGGENELCGRDGQSLLHTEVYDMLSSNQFTHMSGKPKLVITQACSGIRDDRLLRSDAIGEPGQGYRHVPPPQEGVQAPEENAEEEQVEEEDLPVPPAPLPGQRQAYADFYIMKSCAPGFRSLRHITHGTWFIRAISDVLYKHSGHREINTLFEQVRKKVNIQVAKYRRGQLPTGWSWLEPHKKLHLFSGYNPDRETHGDSNVH